MKKFQVGSKLIFLYFLVKTFCEPEFGIWENWENSICSLYEILMRIRT